jgi:dihydroflavonol-4-reductase
MKILLIGATGQVGFAVATALAGSSHSLTVLVRKTAKLGFAANVSVIQVDALDASAFDQALLGQDTVIYGVGLPEQFAPKKDLFERINLGLTTVFMQSLVKSSVRRLIYISTYEVFRAEAGLIRETYPIANSAELSPYFAAMVQAYCQVRETAEQHHIALTTIHPAAVYGGRDTSDGITHYLENILNHRYLKIPTILAGRFPVVHADRLATAISLSLDHEGAFIVSEGMTSLKQIALELRQLAPCFVPPQLPRAMVYASITVMEAGARLVGMRPLLSVSQLDFITKGDEPLADRAKAVMGWEAGDLQSGLSRYLSRRQSLLEG